MKRILLLSVIGVSFLFSSIDLQTASKDKLMCIKGIGEKKADAIIKYRKTHKLKSPDDLIYIKGFGKSIIAKIKNEEKTAKCLGKKSVKKSKKKKKSENSKESKVKKDGKEKI